MGPRIHPDRRKTVAPALSTQIVAAHASRIRDDHSDREMGQGESARIWRHRSINGVEMFHGEYTKYEFARHFHSVPAVGVVEQGTMASYYRKETHVLPAGTVILLNPGEVHAPRPGHSEGWSFRVFFFDDSFFEKQAKRLAIEDISFVQPFIDVTHLSERLLDLHRRFERSSDSLEAESSMLEVFAQLVEKYSSAAPRLSQVSRGKTNVKRVIEYLNANYEKEILLEDLAEIAELSAFHLLRTFRDVVGLPPHAYLNQIRIEAGRRLLSIGHSIASVAALTGFADQSHFTRNFKRILGVTPGQYLPNAAKSRSILPA